MKYKIIIDSSCDLDKNHLKDMDIGFAVIPFTVSVGEKNFIDQEDLKTQTLLDELEKFEGKPISACPSPQSFLDQIKDADKYFIITISSKLSGCYNSAMVAKNTYSNPNDVCVIDSKLASGALVLIVDKLVELINDQIDYTEICQKVENFVDNDLFLLFTLKDYSNFVKNGRLTPLQAIIANTLRITPICAGQEGEIKIVKKLLGSKRLYKEIINLIEEKKEKFSFAKCIISHADNLEGATLLKNQLCEKNLFNKIEIKPMRGLCSFYAMRKGIIISFSK